MLRLCQSVCLYALINGFFVLVLQTTKAKLKELLAGADALAGQLECVPETLSLYLEATRIRVLDIIDDQRSTSVCASADAS